MREKQRDDRLFKKLIGSMPRVLNTLQRTETLPTVWIPSSELRDIRELYRTRMVLTQMVIRLKNRILSCFSKYGISFDETSDAFNIKGRASLEAALEILPTQTCFAVRSSLGSWTYFKKQ